MEEIKLENNKPRKTEIQEKQQPTRFSPSLQAFPISQDERNGIHLWGECYPLGTNQNFEGRSDTIYVTTEFDFRCFKIDLEAKKLSFSKIIPKIYPKEFESVSNKTDFMNFSTKGELFSVEWVGEESESPSVRFYRFSYRIIEEKGSARGEFLGEVKEDPDHGYDLELAWLFEVFEHMVSNRNTFLYSVLKEKGQPDSMRSYSLGSLSVNHQNGLKKHFSLDYKFSSKIKSLRGKLKKTLKGLMKWLNKS